MPGVRHNYSYFPVFINEAQFGISRDELYFKLKEHNILGRRYFYPLLTDFAPYLYAKGSCPIAEDVARRVLTLPTYYGLALDEVRDIAKNVLEMV